MFQLLPRNIGITVSFSKQSYQLYSSLSVINSRTISFSTTAPSNPTSKYRRTISTSTKKQVNIDTVNSLSDITDQLISDRLDKQGYAFIRGASVDDKKKLSDLHPVLFPNEVFDYHKQGGIYSGTRLEYAGVYEFYNVKTSFWDMGVHHDLSYLPYMPSRGCIAHFQKAKEGGCTPLYDNREMWFELMDQYYNVLLELHQYGILYSKTLPDEKNQVKPPLWREADIPTWQETFPGMTKQQIQSALEKKGDKVEWLEDGTFRQTTHKPAFRTHPKTGERFYCNQILSWDARNFWQWPGQPYEKYPFLDRPTHAQIGNGRDLTDQEYLGMKSLHDCYAMRTPWENGDMVIWDNYRISHSRDKYTGERRLAISWGD